MANEKDPNSTPTKSVCGGFVKIIDVLGADTTIVNAARVSYGKQTTEMNENDIKLLRYLADHEHSSPFRHCYIQMHVKAPEFVARQWYKHIVGTEYTFKDTGWNEISGRYVTYDLEAYKPEVLLKQSQSSKQGSSTEPVANEELAAKFHKSIEDSLAVYNELVNAGVAKEQARMVLPLSFYTEWYWTASLQAVCHFVNLRTDSHAQNEIREYARAVDELVKDLFPHAWKALRRRRNQTI
jgi:thymidylate synthase (FAD)